MDSLVSIVVITYNSSAFVVQTLESVKKQTYKNIELIISDDCSQDDTIRLCEEWVHENSCRFSRVTILTSFNNTGISANCNRGFKASRGHWIKLIAGDDLLLENCIADNMDYIIHNPYVRVLQSDTYVIDEESNVISKTSPIDKLFKIAPPNLQFEYFALKYSCNTTTIFIERGLLEEIGWIDEEIKMMEDTQLYIRLTLHGVKLYFHDKVTTAYRCNLSSVSHDNRKCDVFFPSIFNYTIQTYEKYVFPNLNGISLLSQKYRICVIKLFLKYPSINERTVYSKLLYRMLKVPYWMLSQMSLCKIRKAINSKNK